MDGSYQNSYQKQKKKGINEYYQKLEIWNV